MKKPVVLMILDGFGINESHEHNAIYEAKTPNIDRLMKECPYVKGEASGLAVGLPEGQMGNSEVGHTNIGAGRVVYQELTRITKSIEDGDFFENPAFLAASENCKKKGSSLHLFGLIGPGGVHAHGRHLLGLLEFAKRQGLEKVYVHGFLDGRDTAPNSALGFVEELESDMKRIGAGKIATIMGRYYAMDRDKRWDRVQKAYDVMTKAEGDHFSSAIEGIKKSYDADVKDEFVVPFAVMEDGKPVAKIENGDSVIFFNFRPDRAREITRVFCDDDFDGFDRGPRLDTTYVCMVDYDETIPNKLVAFHKETLENTLHDYLASKGLTQVHIAETEKYAHVTFFFDGGVESKAKGEDWVLVDSPKDVATYDLKPEMSAYQVCDKLCEAIKGGKYDFIVVNFANSDMVGHTGVESAAIKAVEAVDECVGRSLEALKEAGGVMFICADHGNSEQMVDCKTGLVCTAHSTNPVPFILVNAEKGVGLRDGGKLCDIAPTIVELLGLEQPKEMTGKSLLTK